MKFKKAVSKIVFIIFLAIAGFVLVRNLNTPQVFKKKASENQDLNQIPQSNIIEDFKAGEWEFKVLNTNNNQSDWSIPGRDIPPDESQVFWKRLTHVQSEKNWTIKVGKGGQLYSISTPQIGELIARQRTNAGEWVDEVFQHTIPSFLRSQTLTPSIVDGDIHQAGYYTKADGNPNLKIIPHSVYAPTFNPVLTEFMRTKNSFSYITWPQHAHLPRTYSENGMLMHQNIRDLGDGVVEITLVVDKWLGEETRLISVPWVGFRTENLSEQILSLPNGSYKSTNKIVENNENQVVKLSDKSTGGWMALVKSNSDDSHGIGIVFGKLNNAISGEYFRLEKYATGTIATVKRSAVLNPGDSIFFRYYLVFGKLKEIQYYGNLLANKVQSGKIYASLTSVGGIQICLDENKELKNGCADTNKKLFLSNRNFVKDSVPLFQLKNKDNNKKYLTTNPYLISSDPTDEKTEYLGFHGWAIKNSDINSFEDNKCYVPIRSVMEGLPIELDDAIGDDVFVGTSYGDCD